MAIYHLSGKIISRSQGRSAVAAGAYRAAEKLVDERTGLTHDFTKKAADVFHREILLPEGAPAWMGERERLWNHVEVVEKRKDAQLAREFNIALPKELTDKQNIELAREFVQKQFVDKGMVADLCLHYGEYKGEKQPHIHVMLSMREVTPDGFGKKERAWNRKDLLLGYREAWAQHCNHHLALHGHDLRIDHRTLEAQGINLEPQTKIGPKEAQARLARLAEHQQIARENGERLLAEPKIAFDAITHQQSTFTIRDIARFAHRHSVDEAQFERVFLALKDASLMVSLGKDERGQARFSTHEMVTLEHEMVKAASALAQAHRHSVNLLIQRKALEGHRLSEEQKAGFAHLTQQGDVACVVGFAGSGKSTLLGATRQAWEMAGYQVQGMTLSGIAAENLAASSHMPSYTIANRLLTWEHGRARLTGRDVVVLDEAGMVDSRQMSAILGAVKQARAKLVLVGDVEQLQAINAGAAFRAIAARVGYVELQTIFRQREAWQQAAVKQFAQGQTIEGLNAYQDFKHTHCYPTQLAASQAMVEHWQETRSNQPDKSLLMLAYTRKEVLQLNEMARSARLANGEIDKGIAVTTARGERLFAEGDILYFLRNDKGLGVKNGSLGTIKRMNDGVLWVQTNSKQNSNKPLLRVDVADYPHLDHGYAATVHKAQGSTVDRSFVLASPYFDRHVTYVALSRHRDGAQLYWGKDEFPSFADLCQQLSRAQHKDITLDYGAVRDIAPIAHASEQTPVEPSMTTDITDMRLKDAEHRMAQRAQEQTQARELQAGMDWLSRQFERPLSNDLCAQDSGVYRGMREVAGQEFGFLEHAGGFKLIAAELCRGLSKGERIQCVQDTHQQLQIARLEAPEKSIEQTMVVQPSEIKTPRKIIEKDIEMDR